MNMFYLENTDQEQRFMYERMLQAMGSLSNLFSESKSPYLASRVTENFFCRYLLADNLSRGDITADAKKNGIGIGIKTWVGSQSQKIAEFNKDRPSYANLETEAKIKQIAKLRNERIDFTMRSQGLSSMIYHCTLRDTGKIYINECPLIPIQIDGISNIIDNEKSITFTDGINKYMFNLSKSTLYKIFDDLSMVKEIDVEIMEDPYSFLFNILCLNANPRDASLYTPDTLKPTEIFLERAYLPLYSANKKAGKYVPPKNNLNMRLAGGRKRDIYEVGIPVPAAFRAIHPDFFPGRESFDMQLPDGTILSVKRCQQDGKALMSNPNSALGHWIIDKVLKIDPEQPITYSMLAKYGIDAVEIDKIKDTSSDRTYYRMNFAKVGAFERYMGISATWGNPEEDEE